MKSVVDSLAAETEKEVSNLSISDRVALALNLGEQAVAIYAAANRVSRAAALRILRCNNQLGRRPSGAASFEDE